MWRRRSPALSTLILINTAVALLLFLLFLTGKMGAFSFSLEPFLALPSSLTGFLHRPWTLLSYMFTHVSLLHLIFNMLWLYWFGMVALDAYSNRFLFYTYIIGGLAGGIFYLATLTLLPSLIHSPGLCGASAAVMCVMTLAALKFPNRSFRLFLIGNVRLKWIALISILLAFIGVGGGGNVGGGLAHVGGVAAGFCIYFMRGLNFSFSPRARFRERKAKKAFEKIRSKNARLDELLDKIRTSGYESLSKKEKFELNSLSEELRKNNNDSNHH